MVLFIKVLIPKTDPSTKSSIEMAVQSMGPSEDREPQSIFLLLRCCNGLVDCSCLLILHLFQLSKPPTQTTLIPKSAGSFPYPYLRCLVFLPRLTELIHEEMKEGSKDSKDQEFKRCFLFASLPVWLASALTDKYNCRASCLTLPSLRSLYTFQNNPVCRSHTPE